MAQVPVVETIYLVGVLVAFAAFILTLLVVSIYTHRPHRSGAVEVSEIDIVVVRGAAAQLVD